MSSGDEDGGRKKITQEDEDVNKSDLNERWAEMF